MVFPLILIRSVFLHTRLENHKSAQQFPDQVEEYLKTEIHHGAILGPDLLIRSVSLHTTLENHKSAQQFPDQVEEYLKTEIHHGAILGPFKDPPFKIHVSPRMTRPKHDSNKCRTILDLS